VTERLLELARQAGLKKPHGSDIEFLADFDWRDFAKLVIEECSELTLDYKSDDHYNGWLDYRTEIRKHFGIKE
jgi:hypothetical protein